MYNIKVMALSSSGLGRSPLTAQTGVRLPVRSPEKSIGFFPVLFFLRGLQTGGVELVIGGFSTAEKNAEGVSLRANSKRDSP